MALLLLSGQACRKKLASREYVRFVQSGESGLAKKVTVDGWEYDFQYKPYDYILLMERAQGNEAKKRLEQLKGTAWFNISICRSDKSVSPLRYNLAERQEYDRRLNYFLNEAAHDIGLLYGGKDTLVPIAYEFENNYNLSPKETMVVGFALPRGQEQPGKSMQLVVNDRLFKNGIIKIAFTEGNLSNIPNLNN